MDTTIIKIAIGMLLFILVSSNSIELFQLASVFIFFAMAIHTFISKFTRKNKLFLIAVYLMIMIFQLVYNSTVIFSGNNNLLCIKCFTPIDTQKMRRGLGRSPCPRRHSQYFFLTE
ncbi:hypothetical protein Holit_03110 [Hollandina sp. SP2]